MAFFYFTVGLIFNFGYYAIGFANILPLLAGNDLNQPVG